MKQHLKGFAAGAILTFFLTSAAFTPTAAPTQKTINALYTNIKIYVDGHLVRPTDTKGNTVEPFTANGTTYLPVRAIANALGQPVNWDQASNSIYIGKAPEQGIRTVTVSNTKELIDAIDSNTRIILKEGTYNFSDVSHMSTSSKVYWRDVFDGDELVINGIQNLTIEGPKDTLAQIHAEARYAFVLSFENCKNITLRNVKAGHTPEKGECSGGVVSLKDCTDINIYTSELFGCGTVGIQGANVQGLKLEGSTVTDCSEGILSLDNCSNLEFKNSKFTQNVDTYYGILIDDSTNVVFDGCDISGNSIKGYDNVLFNSGRRGDTSIVVRNSKIVNNMAGSFELFKGSVKVENSVLENNSFASGSFLNE